MFLSTLKIEHGIKDVWKEKAECSHSVRDDWGSESQMSVCVVLMDQSVSDNPGSLSVGTKVLFAC